MVKERLSKLQKWILIECSKEGNIDRNDARDFFNKSFPPSQKDKLVCRVSMKDNYFNMIKGYEGKVRLAEDECLTLDPKTERYNREKYYVVKEEHISTRSIEATISRTFKNLVEQGFVKQECKWGEYSLTEKGFLKVNNSVSQASIVNNKEFLKGNIMEQKFHVELNDKQPTPQTTK